MVPTDKASALQPTSRCSALLRPALTALILATCIHVAFLTGFSGEMFLPEVRSRAFDSLAENLMRGEANTDLSDIDWEGFSRDGKVYMYFGPWPAILRILPNHFFPSLRGKWARSSCLLATFLCLLGFSLLILKTLDERESLPEVIKRRVLVWSILGFGLGTPLLYCVSCARIYHESILWGLSGAIWCLFASVALLQGWISCRVGLLTLSFVTGITLLSRVTFGVPFYFILFAFFLLHLTKTRRTTERNALPNSCSLSALVLCSIPALTAGVIQLWYNAERFGSPLVFSDFNSFYTQADKIGGTFNLDRIPSTFLIYFGFHFDYLSSLFPYLELAKVRYLNDALFYEWKEHACSLLIGSLWIIPLSISGLWRLLTTWDTLASIFYKWIFISLLGQCILISGYFFATQRYTAEFLPLLTLCYFLGISYSFDSGAKIRRERTGFPLSLLRYLPDLRSVLPVLALFSTVFTLATTLHWNLYFNGDNSYEYKRRVLSTVFPRFFESRSSFFLLREKFGSYFTIDQLDLFHSESEAAHGFEQEVFNAHFKSLFYGREHSNVLLEDGGRRIPKTASWNIDGVLSASDLIIVARYDQNGCGRYELRVNGNATEAELRFRGGPDQWNETWALIPSRFLKEGRNSITMSRIPNDGCSDAEVYYLWFLQSISVNTGGSVTQSTGAAATIKGWQKLIYSSHQQDDYPSYRGPGKSYWSYATDTWPYVEWETERATSGRASAIHFTATMGESEGLAFLFLNDRLIMPFTLGGAPQSKEWEAKGFTLKYVHRAQMAGLSGDFIFTIPAKYLSLGKRAKLSVHVATGDHGTYFMIKE